MEDNYILKKKTIVQGRPSLYLAIINMLINHNNRSSDMYSVFFIEYPVDGVPLSCHNSDYNQELLTVVIKLTKRIKNSKNYGSIKYVQIVELNI